MKTDNPGTQSGLVPADSREPDLRYTEETYRALIEHSDDAIALFSADGAVLYASPSTTRILGYQPDDLLQRNMLEFIRTDWQEKVLETLAEVLRQPGVGIPTHAYIRNKEGEYRFLEGTFTNLLDEPSVGAIVNNYRDITERKQAEAALRESQEKLTLAMRAARMGSWSCELNTGRFEVDEAGMALHGFAPEETITCFEEGSRNVHPADIAEVKRRFDHARKTRGTYENEYRVMLPHGGVRWIYSLGRVSEGSSYLIGMVQDITDRKAAEDELRERERRFSSIINSLPGAVFRVRNDPNYTTEYVSDQIAELTGYPANDFRENRRHFGELMHPDDREWAWNEVQKALGEHRPYELMYRFIDAGGRERWNWERGTGVCAANGELQAIEGFVQDVTERKQAEAALMASTEQLRALSGRLQSAREEEGTRIAREIHDELGGVLTGLKWDLEDCDRVLSGSATEEQVDSIRKKIPVMTGLLDNTIDTVRRISSELRPGVLDDLGLVAAIEWQAQQFQQRTGIECHCEASLETIDLNRDRATAIFRVFQEVLTNVIRHAQATRVELKTFAADGEFVLEVKDNGRGISEPERQNMRSLGLLGMHERVQLIGGTIEISGAKGKGTRVVVRVPLG